MSHSLLRCVNIASFLLLGLLALVVNVVSALSGSAHFSLFIQCLGDNFQGDEEVMAPPNLSDVQGT